MSSSRFYISTPIYYVNDQPHLGTAYSTLLADIFCRYHKMFGKESFFLTGTDEHGQKCQQAALSRDKSPEEHCSEMSKKFQEVWSALHVEYDLFLRTSAQWHKQSVQQALQAIYDKGDIYEGTYKGWYCVSEEIFYTEKDLIDGKSPTGKEVIPIEEKNYFFKMSKYQESLIQYLESHPDWILPQQRQNEVRGFLKKPLQDLCISRSKKRVSWGVELPFDSNYVAYVWVDALLNYITGVGYSRDKAQFDKWWHKGGGIHLIGKDILITHAVYWPCLLMALDLPFPKKILAHGWLLNKEKEKMSKSKGATLDPLELAQTIGVSELRYFLARSLHLGQDAALSKDLILKCIHQDLSNNLGNILSRVSRLVEQNFEGKIPALLPEDKDSQEVKVLAESTKQKVQDFIENFQLNLALEEVSSLLVKVNQYLEKTAPWKLVKTDKESAQRILYTSLEALRFSAVLLTPVMPEKMKKLLKILSSDSSYLALKWGALSSGASLSVSEPLFPRRDELKPE